MACVYILENTVNGKQYVGQSVHTASRRFQFHKSTLKRLQESGEKRGRNWSRLYCAMDKYGVDKFFIVEEISCLLEEMDALEKGLISSLKTIERGYNVCRGGSGGTTKFRTEDFKRKVSEGVRKAWADGKFDNKKTPEFSQEGLSNISKAHKGKPKSAETIEKMIASAKQFAPTRSVLVSGKNNPMFGKKLSQSQKEVIRKARSNPVVVEGVEYASQKLAASYHMVDEHKVKDYLDGTISTISVQYLGVNYRSAKHLALSLGVTITTAKNMLKEHSNELY